ncbi:MAG: hypothetical protein AMXMBFR84_11570 [Candidatus Hydrogenedentota bacterium]
MPYPPAHLPESCQLTLWLAEYCFVTVSPGPIFTPHSLQTIYRTPLYTTSGAPGILNILKEAFKANPTLPPQGSPAPPIGNYITPARRARVVKAIDVFALGGANALTIEQMLIQGIRRNRDARTPRTLEGILKVLANNGIYLANNHTSPSARTEIETLLVGRAGLESSLWDYMGTLGAGGNVQFGSITMRQLFETPAANLTGEFFLAVRRAKRMGILWAHPRYSAIGDPTGIALASASGFEGAAMFYGREGNKKCCYEGACWDSEDDDDYCEPVEGVNPPVCNAMSDPCH